MSQLERRLTEELATAIGKFQKMKESYEREVADRKKMTEMYLESNQACIDAESNVAVLMADNGDLKIERDELRHLLKDSEYDRSELVREKQDLRDQNADLEFRVDQYRRFMDHYFSKEPTGFDDWRIEFQQWKESEGWEE